MLLKILSVIILILVVSPTAVEAQASADQSINSSPTQDRGDSFLGNPAAEMRERAAIKHAEEAHEETLERADESARLGSELRSAYEQHRALGREELKKLERMEKLARKIRGQIGGSEGDEALEDPPRALTDAFTRLAESSENLRQCVSKTSRHVVSTTIIERANELIELIRHIRGFKDQ